VPRYKGEEERGEIITPRGFAALALATVFARAVSRQEESVRVPSAQQPADRPGSMK